MKQKYPTTDLPITPLKYKTHFKEKRFLFANSSEDIQSCLYLGDCEFFLYDGTSQSNLSA